MYAPKDHVSYLSDLVPEKFNQTVCKLSKLIKQHFPTVDVIAGRGLSGSMIIPTLAAKMKLQWAIVRKGKTHSDFKVEVSKVDFKVKVSEVAPYKRSNKTTNVVFVDDLIDSGNTYKVVKKQVESKYAQSHIDVVFLGAALYNYFEVKTAEKLKQWLS